MPYDADDFAQGVTWTLADNDRYKRLSQSACIKAGNKFTKEHMVRQYNDLYRDVLAASG